MLLSDKYPFLADYFTKVLSATDKPLPQSILFYGNDLNAQYLLSKEIAKFLNCKEDKSDSCECLNCKWIKENSHPAVLTFSRIDNKIYACKKLFEKIDHTMYGLFFLLFITITFVTFMLKS